MEVIRGAVKFCGKPLLVIGDGPVIQLFFIESRSYKQPKQCQWEEVMCQRPDTTAVAFTDTTAE